MALEAALIHFIGINADKGRDWIGLRLQMTPEHVSHIACKHRISLRKEGENRGRKPNDKSKAQRNKENKEIRGLSIEHEKVQMIYASRGLTDKDRLRTRKWKEQRKRVLNRDHHTCTYCGDVANSVDHVIPRVAGGDDSMDNLVSACMKCNSRKGSMNGDVFLARAFTPPAFIDKISPKGANQSKPVQNGHTTIHVDADSPFISPGQPGAN
jgi:hypothetical protein